MNTETDSAEGAHSYCEVLVAGEINVDIVVTSADLAPLWGQERLVDGVTLAPGSSSAICAAQMAKLGLRTGFIGKVGPDLFGRFMMEALAGAGVDTSSIIVDPSLATGATVSLSAPTERALFTYVGAIDSLPAEDIVPSLVCGARHLHVSSFFLQSRLRPGLAGLFASARAAGLTTSLDTGWDPSERWDGDLRAVLDQVDIFLPNEVEAFAITGTSDAPAALAVLRRLVPSGAIKLGADGAVGWADERVVWQPAFPVTAVDTTGAGDNFNAGYIYGRLAEMDLEGCLRTGCACAALSVTQPGGFSAQPGRDELRTFLSSRIPG